MSARSQGPSTVFSEYLISQTQAGNILVAEYDVVRKERPIHFCMHDLNIPRWLLVILASLSIVVLTACAMFFAIASLSKATNADACRTHSKCRQDLGLLCDNYRCSCGYSHFWSDSLRMCERQRKINQPCVNDSMCDEAASLQCQNVSRSGQRSLECQCKTGLSWNGQACVFDSFINTTCFQASSCDTSRFLICNLVLNLCQCNSSMFWNGNPTAGTCEYKRTINQYCKPYDNDWCDNTEPLGQGLTCAAYSNPYSSAYGVCQCTSTYYYNGSVSLGNGYCVPLLLNNQACVNTTQCDYRVGLVCTNNLCACPPGKAHDPTITSIGLCVPAVSYDENCTNSTQCSNAKDLYCDYTTTGSLSYGVCACNASWSFWEGSICRSQLSIGAECMDNTYCRAADGLICSIYPQSAGTCDCPQDYYWDNGCVLKQWYNTSCSSSYVCDDYRGLTCQGLGTAMFQRCDCTNDSLMWDSVYRNQTFSCVPKKSFNQSPCYGDLECQETNYLICKNGTCDCDYTDFWDGRVCQVKRTFTAPCSSTYQCKDYSPINLTCQVVPPSHTITECLCPTYLYWDQCLQRCAFPKQMYEGCLLGSNCSAYECDQANSLECVSNPSAPSTGWCGCNNVHWPNGSHCICNITRTGAGRLYNRTCTTNTRCDNYDECDQSRGLLCAPLTNVSPNGTCDCLDTNWWNGTYCREKGVPAWGTNRSAVCNATYQCATYSLVSCPLGSSSVASIATCECATTKYWNGLVCLDRGIVGSSCTNWLTNPVNTTTCLSAAGAGLWCIGGTCSAGTCTGGTCICPAGTTWNSTFRICAAPTAG